jgi:hypothetical protein
VTKSMCGEEKNQDSQCEEVSSNCNEYSCGNKSISYRCKDYVEFSGDHNPFCWDLLFHKLQVLRKPLWTISHRSNLFPILLCKVEM